MSIDENIDNQEEKFQKESWKLKNVMTRSKRIKAR